MVKVRELIALLIECNPDSAVLIRLHGVEHCRDKIWPVEPRRVEKAKHLNLVYIEGDGSGLYSGKRKGGGE